MGVLIMYQLFWWPVHQHASSAMMPWPFARQLLLMHVSVYGMWSMRLMEQYAATYRAGGQSAVSNTGNLDAGCRHSNMEVLDLQLVSHPGHIDQLIRKFTAAEQQPKLDTVAAHVLCASQPQTPHYRCTRQHTLPPGIFHVVLSAAGGFQGQGLQVHGHLRPVE